MAKKYAKMRVKDPQGNWIDIIQCGKDGDSAYQVAVRNGYRGSEADWLESLKGEKGDPGTGGGGGIADAPADGSQYTRGGGKWNKLTVDNELSEASHNPVANATVTAKLLELGTSIDNIEGNLRIGVFYDKKGKDVEFSTVSSTPLIPITPKSVISFLTSKKGASYNNYVYFDTNKVFINGVDDSKLIIDSGIPSNAAFIGINQDTSSKQEVKIDGKVVFGFVSNVIDDISSLKENSTKINRDLDYLSANNNKIYEYENFVLGVNTTQYIFNVGSEYSTFLNPGYRISSNKKGSYVKTKKTELKNNRVALCVNIYFDKVTDDFRFQMGFNDIGWDSRSKDFTASDFGLKNLTGTTQTFTLIWDSTKSSAAFLYIYKGEVADGQEETYTIKNLAILNMGHDSSNALYNKDEKEINDIFSNSFVEDSVVTYGDYKVKRAEYADNITLEAIAKSYKYFGKKVVTIGDSLVANLVWQPRLAKYTGLIWNEKETSEGVGYVNIQNGEYTLENKSEDPSFRKAYKMAIGGTTIKPTNENSIYIRANDAKYYNPDIIIIYGGQNDYLPWKSLENDGKTPSEIVMKETPYIANDISDSVSTISAYKGMIEKLMEDCPNAIIYLVTQMRVLGRVGMVQQSTGQIRFKTQKDVIDWEFKDRYPKVQYIREIAKLYGLPLIDLWDKSGITDYNSEHWYGEPATDCTQVHPQNIGYYRMADVMIQSM